MNNKSGILRTEPLCYNELTVALGGMKLGSGNPLPQLLLQALLIGVNAIFAAAEFAVMSLNENKLRRQAEDGDKKAAQMLRMVEQPSGFLSSIQIAITLAGFLGSAFAAHNFSYILTSAFRNIGVGFLSDATLNTISVVLTTLILAYFTLVLGELVPKRIAMKKPEKVAGFVCGIVSAVNRVAKPLVWLLSKSTNGILRLFGIDPVADVDNVTEDEIRMMVDIGEEKGTIAEAEKEMIENVFEFNNMTAADCMTHRTDMTAIWVDESQEEIVRIIESTGLSRFPVYQEDLDDVLGILTTRDFLLNRQQAGQKPIRELLRPALFVPESVRADILFRDMQKNKAHIAIVVDEYGGTSGLITMEDLLEEIVGNIYDEYDPQVQQDIISLGSNKWRVAGSVEIEALAEAIDIELPNEYEYSTLGGLVLSRLNAIPMEGEHPEVDIFGLHIRVEKVADRRIEWAEVEKVEGV
jgi:putative hemolysin